jgi:hypothetical protein
MNAIQHLDDGNRFLPSIEFDRAAFAQVPQLEGTANECIVMFLDRGTQPGQLLGIAVSLLEIVGGQGDTGTVEG